MRVEGLEFWYLITIHQNHARDSSSSVSSSSVRSVSVCPASDYRHACAGTASTQYQYSPKLPIAHHFHGRQVIVISCQIRSASVRSARVRSASIGPTDLRAPHLSTCFIPSKPGYPPFASTIDIQLNVATHSGVICNVEAFMW